MSERDPLDDGADAMSNPNDWKRMIDENNRKRDLEVRSRLIRLSDEPCSSCGRPAGDLRVLEGIHAAAHGNRLPPLAICEPCFREQNGMQRKTEESR